MSQIIKKYLINRAWEDLHAQTFVGAFASIEFELDGCTYKLVGKIDRGYFERVSADYLRGTGTRYPRATFIPAT